MNKKQRFFYTNEFVKYMKTTLIAFIAIAVLIGGIYFLSRSDDGLSTTGFVVKEVGQENILTGNVVLDTSSDVGRKEIQEQAQQASSGGSSARVTVSITVVENKTE